eukprot:tig00001486_g8928.t1
MMEAMPSTRGAVVAAGAVQTLCGRLRSVEYIELAEQSVLAIERLAPEYSPAVLRAGGLHALLAHLDFFTSSQQRAALQAAGQLCRGLPPELFVPQVAESGALDVLAGLVASPDAQLVEAAVACLARLVESLSGPAHEPHLARIAAAGPPPGLLAALLAQLAPAQQHAAGSAASAAVLRLLGNLCRGAPAVAAELVRRGAVPALAALLREEAEACEAGTALAPPLRPQAPDYLDETLALSDELLPALVRGAGASEGPGVAAAELEAFVAALLPPSARGGRRRRRPAARRDPHDEGPRRLRRPFRRHGLPAALLAIAAEGPPPPALPRPGPASAAGSPAGRGAGRRPGEDVEALLFGPPGPGRSSPRPRARCPLARPPGPPRPVPVRGGPPAGAPAPVGALGAPPTALAEKDYVIIAGSGAGPAGAAPGTGTAAGVGLSPGADAFHRGTAGPAGTEAPGAGVGGATAGSPGGAVGSPLGSRSKRASRTGGLAVPVPFGGSSPGAPASPRRGPPGASPSPPRRGPPGTPGPGAAPSSPPPLLAPSVSEPRTPPREAPPPAPLPLPSPDPRPLPGGGAGVGAGAGPGAGAAGAAAGAGAAVPGAFLREGGERRGGGARRAAGAAEALADAPRLFAAANAAVPLPVAAAEPAPEALADLRALAALAHLLASDPGVTPYELLRAGVPRALLEYLTRGRPGGAGAAAAAPLPPARLRALLRGAPSPVPRGRPFSGAAPGEPGAPLRALVRLVRGCLELADALAPSPPPTSPRPTRAGPAAPGGARSAQQAGGAWASGRRARGARAASPFAPAPNAAARRLAEAFERLCVDGGPGPRPRRPRADHLAAAPGAPGGAAEEDAAWGRFWGRLADEGSWEGATGHAVVVRMEREAARGAAGLGWGPGRRRGSCSLAARAARAEPPLAVALRRVAHAGPPPASLGPVHAAEFVSGPLTAALLRACYEGLVPPPPPPGPPPPAARRARPDPRRHARRVAPPAPAFSGGRAGPLRRPLAPRGGLGFGYGRSPLEAFGALSAAARTPTPARPLAPAHPIFPSSPARDGPPLASLSPGARAGPGAGPPPRGLVGPPRARLPLPLPFEARRLHFELAAFGAPRAASALLRRHEEAGRGGPATAAALEALRIPKVPRQKVRVSRGRVLECAYKAMELYGGRGSSLEVEYFEEAGTGLGPTLEFYTLVCQELQRKGLHMWRDDEPAPPRSKSKKEKEKEREGPRGGGAAASEAGTSEAAAGEAAPEGAPAHAPEAEPPGGRSWWRGRGPGPAVGVQRGGPGPGRTGSGRGRAGAGDPARDEQRRRRRRLLHRRPPPPPAPAPAPL